MKKENTMVSIKNIASIDNLNQRSKAIYYLFSWAQYRSEIQATKDKIYLSGIGFASSFFIYFWGNLLGKLYFINLIVLIVFSIALLRNIRNFYKTIEFRNSSYEQIETILQNPDLEELSQESYEELLQEMHEIMNDSEDNNSYESY